eukprot:jgi/Ulvmu1/5346/UM022_0140.1
MRRQEGAGAHSSRLQFIRSGSAQTEALALRTWYEMCATQFLLQSAVGEELSETELTPKDTAGWIILCMQFQKLHSSMEVLTEEVFLTNPAFKAVLQEAMSVLSFGDLQAVCGPGHTFAESVARFISTIQGRRCKLIASVTAALGKLGRLEVEEGLPCKIKQLSPAYQNTLKCGGMGEADAELMAAMDSATDLLSCLKPSHLVDIRGQVQVCNMLMNSSLGSTAGIRLAFDIDSEKAVKAGGCPYLAGIQSALTWLRQMWKGMFDQVERGILPWNLDCPLRDSHAFKQTTKLAKNRILADRHATRDPINQQKKAARLPTEQESCHYHLRGFAAGCQRYIEKYPIHPLVRPPECMNKADLVTPDEAEAVNSTYHQAAMLAPTLMRGDEAAKLPLVSLGTHHNTAASPLSLEAGKIDVQWAKDNYGNTMDDRLIAHGQVIHHCPLVHAAIYFYSKIHPTAGPRPFTWPDITSGAWQMMQVVDTDFPPGLFRKGSADVIKLTRRRQKANQCMYGRNDVGKTLHLDRRSGAERMTLAGASDEQVRKAGGWNKTTAMEKHYMTSASPEAACVSAGFRGLKDYCPSHKYAEPFDDLIKLVFGTVLTKRDPITGTTLDLDVDEAIAACIEHHDNSNGQGVSAAPLFKFLCLIAKTLLQAMPKLRQLWPSHWISFIGIRCSSGRLTMQGGTMPASPEPYLPEQHLEAMAREVGPGVFARWNFEDKMPDPAADPCLSTALLRPPVPAVQEADDSGIVLGQLSFNHVNRWLTFALRDATALAQVSETNAAATFALVTSIARTRDELREIAGDDIDAAVPLMATADPRLISKAVSGLTKELRSSMNRAVHHIDSTVARSTRANQRANQGMLDTVVQRLQSVATTVRPAENAGLALNSNIAAVSTDDDHKVLQRNQLQHLFSFGKQHSVLDTRWGRSPPDFGRLAVFR